MKFAMITFAASVGSAAAWFNTDAGTVWNDENACMVGCQDATEAPELPSSDSWLAAYADCLDHCPDGAKRDEVPATSGRCGPHFQYNSCTHGKYCNEGNGYCGPTAAHRDAQDSSTYDANDAAVRVALTGPRVPTPNRCGPLFHMNTCDHDKYCNEANGWCGESDVHRDAQISTAYDGRCIHKDCSDWDCALWCECFDGTSCAASILFFNRSLPAIAHSLNHV